MSFSRLAPGLFVLLWSTGWVVAKYAAPHADALTFLSVRFACAFVVVGAFSLAMSARWPKGRRALGEAAFSGMLLHAMYLGSVWWAIGQGVPAALSGLIAALQPLLTVISAPYVVGERLSRQQIFGIVLGFAGLIVAILPDLFLLDGSALTGKSLPIGLNILGMVAVTAGSLYQKKRFQTGDLGPISALQYLGAFIVTLPVAYLVEDMRIDFSPQFFFALAWSVFGLSFGAVALYLYLIRRGQVSRAASLIYLVPPVVALQTFSFFGERLSPAMIIGTLIVVLGVYLCNRPAIPPVR